MCLLAAKYLKCDIFSLNIMNPGYYLRTSQTEEFPVKHLKFMNNIFAMIQFKNTKSNVFPKSDFYLLLSVDLMELVIMI